ncbi:2364_t:CDS:10, partial [Funneliformis geosporum]
YLLKAIGAKTSENFKEFFSQEEIDKMSYDEKFFPPCKCGKYGEEVCHKCAPCVKCGKESYGDYFTEKPRLPKKEPRQVEKCDHCGKLGEIKVGSAYWGKSFCSSNCYELAYARVSSLKNRDEIRAHCCVCRFRIFGEDNNFTEDFKNRKGMVYYSDGSINSFYCSETCFEKRGDKSGMSGSAFHDRNPTSSGNSPKPIPAVPNSQPITNKSDKNNVKVIKFEDNLLKPTENSPVKTDNQTLIINLKSIKHITLTSDNNLVIEFNKVETNSARQEVEIVNDKQIGSSQELQKIKNYLQGSGEKSINQQKLNSILNFDNTNTGITDEPDNYTLAVGLSVIFVLSGLTIGEEIDASTVCCIDCLHKFEYDEEGCHIIINRHEEAEHEGEFEKYKQAQEKAQKQECERVVENMKQEKYWANNVREGEVPIQIVEEFQEKEIEFYDSDNPPLEIEEGERIVMTDEQVDNNQELQKVRNYLQKNNKVSLNQRELTEFFNSSSVPVEAPKDINRLLKIGGGAVLVFGVLG